MAAKVPLYIEKGEKRVIASAVDWPGWARSAKTEAEALDRLAAYAPRYAPIARAADAAFPEKVSASDLEVVERLAGNATTEYGVLAMVGGADAGAHSTAQARRIADLMRAAWEYLDGVLGDAPATLTKGPRGGGRDRDQIHEHVVGAEFDAYARKIGIKLKFGGLTDTSGIKAGRRAILEAVSKPSDGTPPPDKRWPTAYMARRTAWHALDHAWEIEDRTP